MSHDGSKNIGSSPVNTQLPTPETDEVAPSTGTTDSQREVKTVTGSPTKGLRATAGDSRAYHLSFRALCSGASSQGMVKFSGQYCQRLAGFNRWLNDHYQKPWIVHFAKPSKNHHRNIKYLGRYLKRPALSMSRLKHYDGKEVIFSYLNHTTKAYLRFSSKVEDFIKRFWSNGINLSSSNKSSLLLRLP